MGKQTKEKIASFGLIVATLILTGYLGTVLYTGIQTY